MNGSYTQIDDETRAYQEQTASIRFKQNLIHGVGAATVFGFATGVFGVLFRLTGLTPGGVATGTAALSTTTMAWAWGGIALAVVVGFGCLYMASKLASELVRIEQDHHAKQIAKGINGKSPAIEPQKPIPFPAQDKAADALDVAEGMNVAKPQVREVSLQDKVVSLDAHKMARAGA